MNLGEMLRDTDALTYINALKVTLTEIKSELSEQDNMYNNMTISREKCRKLIRKADNQYRMVAKVVQNQGVVASDLTIDDSMEEFEKLMQEGAGDGN